MDSSILMCAPTDQGYLLRIVGRGTMRESPTVREFVTQCLEDGMAKVVIDLSQCDYVDSTFMGCMIWLHKYAGEAGDGRLRFYATAKKARELFAFSLLDRVLNVSDQRPDPTEEFLVLTVDQVETNELGRHVAECHRRLAEMGGKEAKNYSSVAERIAKELDDSRS